MLGLNNENNNKSNHPHIVINKKKKKKRVPEWLNAPIWYSPPSLPNLDLDVDGDADVDDNGYPTPPPPPPRPPPPTPPPPPTRFTKPSSHPDDPSTSHSPSLSPDDVARHAQLLVEMSKKVINMKEVRRLASFSVPDGPSSPLRSSLWKLLLGYLPPERSLWSAELTMKRAQYKHLKDDLFLTPSEITRRLHKSDPIQPLELTSTTRQPLPRSQIPPSDHPLTLVKSSVWHNFFQDAEILEQIDRDVKRTHPDIQFFSGDTSLAKSTQDAMRNILIVFAKLNPGIRYVQGMNEILAPLFYVFCNDPDGTNVAAAEADTFFCFSELLSGFRDNFCQQLDNSIVGIRSTITKLSLLLKEHDEELWRHLEVTCKINPQFYAFRWITLLLTQEFSFMDIFHIWDALLSDPEGPQETLLRICCGMLILVRRRLLAGDFTSNLKLLQHYPSTNISHLLYVAHKLRAHPTS